MTTKTQEAPITWPEFVESGPRVTLALSEEEHDPRFWVCDRARDAHLQSTHWHRVGITPGQVYYHAHPGSLYDHNHAGDYAP